MVIAPGSLGATATAVATPPETTLDVPSFAEMRLLRLSISSTERFKGGAQSFTSSFAVSSALFGSSQT